MTSTTYNPNYDSNKWMYVYNKNNELIRDPLNVLLYDLVEGLDYNNEHVYSGECFTTLVYRVYGTVTLWDLVLLYNGISHPLDLQAGMVIRFPVKQQIDFLILALQKVDQQRLILV